MKTYYYVYRLGRTGPTIKHNTLKSAHTEAMRLAAQHPGDSFEILLCLATTRTATPQTFWMDGVTLSTPLFEESSGENNEEQTGEPKDKSWHKTNY
jgi:hypothetical protein